MKLFPIFALILLIAVCPTFAQDSSSLRDQLKQLIADLQKSPSDTALREKIIKLALTLDPKPVVPEETKRFVARGLAAAEEAKETKDYRDAAAEFEKASLAAPWLGQPYRDLGIVQDKAGDYAAATRNLKLYLLSEPDSAEAEKAKELIYKIEFKQEKAEKELEAKAEEQRRQQRSAEAAKAAQDQRISSKRQDNQKFVGHWAERYPNGNLVRDSLTLALNDNGDLVGVGPRSASLEIQVDGSRIVFKSTVCTVTMEISTDSMKMMGSAYCWGIDNSTTPVTYVKQ